MKFLDKLFSWEYGGYETFTCSCGETYKVYNRIPTLSSITAVERELYKLETHIKHRASMNCDHCKCQTPAHECCYCGETTRAPEAPQK